MLHRAIEGQVTWISGLSQSDIPFPWPPSISIRIRADALGIEPQGVVGTIPLLNGDTLQISPKIGRINFFRLFLAAGGVQHDLDREFQEFVGYSAEDEPNLDYLVARHLYAATHEILRRSPQIGREHRRHQGLFAKGRLDTRATALNVALKRQEPVVSWSRERTYDIPENRILTEAIIRAQPLLPDVDDDITYVYSKWLSRFPRSSNLWADLEHVSRGFAFRHYGGSRDYYRKALMLAQVILGNSGLGFGDMTELEGDAVLLNTATIYERYLRNVIARSHADSGYVVAKAGGWTTSLYTDGSREIIPDIVVSRGGSIRLLADAKYKVPDSQDHYQMYAYLHVMNVASGILLSPSFSDNENITLRQFSTTDGKVIREVYLPMMNLKATEDFLSRIVQEFGL